MAAIMFKKLPCIGSLYLEKTLYCKATPEIFVCTDDMGKRYLCAAQPTPGQWFVGRINTRQLIAVLKDRLPLYTAIRGCKVRGIVTGLLGKFSFSLGIPEDAYPSGSRLLELWDFDWGVQEYCETLEQELRGKKQ